MNTPTACPVTPNPMALRRLLAVLPVLALLAATGVRAADKPNFLFLFADDYCYEAVRAFGHTDIDTPNLDRLAARGTTFTHAYNMGSWSGAVCIASRTMLITGRSVWDAESVNDSLDREREAGALWPQLMASAGYRTYFTGKWHIKTDAAKCFDVARHVRPGMPKDTPDAYNRPRAGQPDSWSPYDRSKGGFWEGGKHWSEVVAEDALDYLGDPERGDSPFFMYIAFNAPHDPRQAPKEFVDRYPLDRVAVPESFLPEYPHKDKIGCGPGLRDEKLGPFPRNEHAVKVHRGEYYALITHLDVQVGRILDALEASGEAGNTWIVFTADHGLAVGHHGLFGKQNMYDHSVRVPFIVSAPGVEAGRTVATPIYLQDVMATSLDLAGARKPDHLFFHSVLPLLEGTQQDSSYGAVYGGYLGLQRAITRAHWKLIAYPEAGVLRLYHLGSDPLEQSDLAGDPGQSDMVSDLFGQLVGLQRELGDQLDLRGAFPDLP